MSFDNCARVVECQGISLSQPLPHDACLIGALASLANHVGNQIEEAPVRSRKILLATSWLIGCGDSALGQATVRLHEPTGDYSVGRRTLMLVDRARQEPG